MTLWIFRISVEILLKDANPNAILMRNVPSVSLLAEQEIVTTHVIIHVELMLNAACTIEQLFVSVLQVILVIRWIDAMQYLIRTHVIRTHAEKMLSVM